MINPFWQSEWQNIQFSTLNVPLTIFKRPSLIFYDAFYKEMFVKYKNFEELPFQWKKNKGDTAKAINDIVRGVSSVLSIGCGLGFVEKSLIEIDPTLKIDAFDFSDIAKKWLKDIKGINCLTKLESANKYEFIYCTQLLYALSDKKIKELAGFVLQHLGEDGKFLTVDTSLNPSENSSKPIDTRRKLMGLIKNYLSPFYYLLFKRGFAQFFGWQRDNYEIIKLFESNGLKLNKKLSRELQEPELGSVGQSFLIFELNIDTKENF
jgi:hypothetical protein